jgi:hypothetical protein
VDTARLRTGMDVEITGHHRDFDSPEATHLAIMAELVRLGVSAPEASRAIRNLAVTYEDKARLIFVPRFAEAEIKRMAAIRKRLEQISIQVSSGPFSRVILGSTDIPIKDIWFEGEPTSYIIINVEKLIEKMRAAQEKWERRGQEKLPRKRSARKAND